MATFTGYYYQPDTGRYFYMPNTNREMTHQPFYYPTNLPNSYYIPAPSYENYFFERQPNYYYVPREYINVYDPFYYFNR